MDFQTVFVLLFLFISVVWTPIIVQLYALWS